MSDQDDTPVDRPINNRWASQDHARDQLQLIIIHLEATQTWCKSLLKEIDSGNVPDWESESAERMADLRRRVLGLESLSGLL